MTPVKIDVAIPCYQYGRFLRNCVKSVLDQGVPEVRVLIIDNASTDNSAEVASQLTLEDSRVSAINHPSNRGPHASYNEAIDWAAADYFLILDADDVLAPGALRRAASFLDVNPGVAFVHGAVGHIVGSQAIPDPRAYCAFEAEPHWDVVPGHRFIEDFCRFIGNMASAPSVIRRTAAQKAAGYYRQSLRYTDDVELWLRLALQGDVGKTDSLQAWRRLHLQQATTEFRDNPVLDFREHEAALISFFENEGKSMPRASEWLAAGIRNIEAHAYWSGISHFVRGYRREAQALHRYANRRARFGVALPPLQTLFEHKRPIARALEIIMQTSAARPHGPGHDERQS